MSATVTLRTASPTDVPAIHRLITDNLEVGNLLPRSIEDVERHAARFVVASIDDAVVGYAVDLVTATRSAPEIALGASQRRYGLKETILSVVAVGGPLSVSV